MLQPEDPSVAASIRDDDEFAEASVVAAKEAGFHIRQAIDQNNLREAMKHTNALLWELRVSSLTHVQYYRLYCTVIQELARFDSYFRSDEFRFRRRFLDLYETVQHAGNATPRLYLTITVARHLIGSGERPTGEVLRDLVRMLKIVQHPLRGLYARYYMLSTLGDVINQAIDMSPLKDPDADQSTENASSSLAATSIASSAADVNPTDENKISEQIVSEQIVQDCSREEAFDFYFENLQACSKLLTRLEYLKGRGLAGKEAKTQHAFIITAAMQRIAKIQGLDSKLFKERVAPKCLEFIASLQNPDSQAMLLEALVNNFPPDLLLLQLGDILAVLFKSHITEMSGLLQLLNERFSQDSQAEGLDGPQLATQIQTLIKESINMLGQYCADVSVAEVPLSVTPPPLVRHWVMLLKTATIVMPINGAYCHELAQSVGMLLYHFKSPIADMIDAKLEPKHIEAIEQGRAAPVEEVTTTLAGFLEVLIRLTGLSDQASLLTTEIYAYSPESERCKLSEAILTGLVKTADVKDADRLSRILSIATPYITTQSSVQQLARLTHQVVDKTDSDKSFGLLALIRASCDCLKTVDCSPVLAGLIYEVSSVARSVGVQEIRHGKNDYLFDTKKLLQFVHGCCSELKEPYLSLTMSLVAAATADWLDQLHWAVHNSDGSFELATYEFLSMALCVYEEQLVHSKDEFPGLLSLIEFMRTQIFALGEKNYEDIVARLCNYSARLLRRPEQCRSILKCSLLFWKAPCKDAQRVVECLMRAMKTAELALATTSAHSSLVNEVEELAMWFRENGNELVPVDFKN